MNLAYREIPGWGMDIDPKNEPTYPMKNYTGDDHNRSNYVRSIDQSKTVEILKSNERPQLSAVFGTTVPPSGLSGKIRRWAFTHSEDRYRHWIPLILADRVNMVEGLIDDISKGRVPNIIKERGWKMDLKHNPTGVLVKLITCAVAGYTLYCMCKKK